MLRRIASKVQDEGLKKEIRDVAQHESIDTYGLAELLDSMEDQGLHIVLLIDEFENVGGNENFGPDFYYALRSLAIHHDLALITSTRVDLVEISHSDAVRSSPFFNIFATISLRPFSQADVRDMVSSYLADKEVSFSDAAVEHVLTLSGRVPFFVQMALHFMFEAAHQGLDESSSLAHTEERLQQAAAPHLDNYWANSSQTEKTAMALLALQAYEQDHQLNYWRPAELGRWFVHTGLALSTLSNRGLVIREGDRYALGSTTKYRGLFARWLSDARASESALELLTAAKMPFQELRSESHPAAERIIAELTDAERAQAQLAAIEGTVSIMFTDLEDSTKLLTSLGDEANQTLLRSHNSIIRQHVANNGGLEVKAMGDGFMVVFSSARKAVTCAAEIQRSLDEFNLENADQLKVRIGINVGETIKEDEDFFGTAVVLAARIMALASGEQILVSDLFRKLAGSASSFEYVEYGWKQLKGFAEEEHLYEVAWRASTRQ